MRTISKSRNHFHGTHKGYEIEIEREKPRPEQDEKGHFYIRVWKTESGMHAYDGWSPVGVTTLAEAKREALYGACLKSRPTTQGEGEQ